MIYGGPTTIEQGYFVFTLMPSLRCPLNCPHCYLTPEQRGSDALLPLSELETVCVNIRNYYETRGILRKRIICYWYGGEPTSMGQGYFVRACDLIASVFSLERGYHVTHAVLTSLINVDESWYPILGGRCANRIQTSYDGLMRGRGYLQAWEAHARKVMQCGVRLSTVSVVNRELLTAGAAATYEYLADLGIEQTSWLPFMLTERNASGSYDRFAPTMDEYSDFMIHLTRCRDDRIRRGRSAPMIGQREFILQKGFGQRAGNTAVQTLFLLPNGDLALPDYPDGRIERLTVFGNALSQSFEEVLNSETRRRYLRKQVQRNGNPECAGCTYSTRCIMEFWKPNRLGDDCFGARRYIEWLLGKETASSLVLPPAMTIS